MVSAFFAVMTILILPAGAVNGTIEIAYRGYGGNYLGDPVILDGRNTFSNGTALKMTGPGLPAEGLPLMDLNGQPGTGNSVVMNPDGTWKYVWYTGSIKGSEKLQTARYYITAFDLANSAKTATTSLLLKKPEFYVDVSPSQAGPGEYIQLTGISEKGSTSVHFDISDESGKTVHKYDSTVSASGYFNAGFHVDMPPGVYTVIMTSPTTRSSYRNYLTVTESTMLTQTPTPVPLTTAIVTPETQTTAPATPVTSATPAAPAGFGTLSVSSTPLGATVFVDSEMKGPTPLDLKDIAAGNHIVEIKAPGYSTYSLDVPVKAGETTRLNPVLVKSPAAPLPPAVILA
ncbi:MAG: PEGA domain-containing protein, partial [Methanomicrobiales archaeon]|nr:PEGA domain-containing protein [Methanomicrobiales archaeon]